jgi:hypothetical protein
MSVVQAGVQLQRACKDFCCRIRPRLPPRRRLVDRDYRPDSMNQTDRLTFVDHGRT